MNKDFLSAFDAASLKEGMHIEHHSFDELDLPNLNLAELDEALSHLPTPPLPPIAPPIPFSEKEKKAADSTAPGLPIKLITADGDDPLDLPRIGRKLHRDPVFECITFPLSTSDITENCRIPFRHEDTDCELIFSKKTTVIPTDNEVNTFIISRPRVYYRFEDDSERFPFECLCATDEKTFNLFGRFANLQEKAHQIAVFSQLSDAQKEFVFSMASRPNLETEESAPKDPFTPIRDIKALEMMYEVCKHTYKPSVRSRIESLRSQLALAHGTDKTDIINQLAFAIGIDTEAHEHPKRTYEECMAIMDKHIYGLTELKENVVEFIIAMQESGSSYFRMLLVGPPGVGKTSFTNAIAECLGDTPIIHIDCSGVNVITMSGLIKSYGGAKAGKVMDGLFEKGRTDVVMLLDEIDKMAADKDGDPYSALIKPLGPQKKYYDEYVADDTDVSATKFIATANDMSKIPGYILSRFENNIFYLNAYSKEEKLEIAQKHIIPRKLAEFKLSPENCIFTEEALALIIDGFCSDEGVRELEGNITILFRKIITEWSRGLIKMPFCVGPNYVRSRIKKKNPASNTRKIGFSL